MNEISHARRTSRDIIPSTRGYGHFEERVPREHRTYSGGTNRTSIDLEGTYRTIDLRDLLEVQVEASKQLMAESRVLMTLSI